jgi:putative membrane protein (TIGR04086 family)
MRGTTPNLVSGFRVLTVLRFKAIIAGVASGTLASGVAFVILALAARAFRSEAITGLSLSLSLLLGMVAGGYLAGRLAMVNPRFHGSITGLVLAALTVIIAVRGGSPAPLGAVLLLAVVAILAGGLGGTWGGRRVRIVTSSPGDRGSNPEESPDSAEHGAG